MIKNVVAVYRLQCSLLEDDSPLAMSSNIEKIMEDGERIEIVVPAKFSFNNKVVDNIHIFENQLIFKTCQKLEVRGHWAYALVLADGSRILIGSLNRPYPITVSSQTLPDNLSDSQLEEVTVTLSQRAQVPLLG